jgi:hypothetical protein
MRLVPITPDMEGKAAEMSVEYNIDYRKALEKVREEATKKWMRQQDISKSSTARYV